MRIIDLENKRMRVRTLVSENTIKIIDLPSMQKSLHSPAFGHERLYLVAALL